MTFGRVSSSLSVVSLSVLLSLGAVAQRPHDGPPDAKPAVDAGKPAEKAADVKALELPADKSVEQTITVHGKTLHYTATVGTIRLTDEKGKPTGDVMYTAYVLDHEKGSPDRPVLFAVNGGPGASSVYLNLGRWGRSIFRLRMRVSRLAIRLR
jgi:carboxypeptidase C (cathepsin A)